MYFGRRAALVHCRPGIVMAGLVPASHVFFGGAEDVDAGDKRGC